MLHIKIVVLVALGGAIGAVFRYGLNVLAQFSINKHFPFGIMLINILGCFIMGWFYIVAQKAGAHWTQEWKIGLTTGILGAFTTFSTFSLDTVVLIQQGEQLKAFANILGNLILCLLAVYIGMQYALKN